MRTAAPRTVNTWMKQGLEYIRLPSGTVLIHEGAIDKFLTRYSVSENHVDRVADEVMREMAK